MLAALEQQHVRVRLRECGRRWQQALSHRMPRCCSPRRLGFSLLLLALLSNGLMPLISGAGSRSRAFYVHAAQRRSAPSKSKPSSGTGGARAAAARHPPSSNNGHNPAAAAKAAAKPPPSRGGNAKPPSGAALPPGERPVLGLGHRHVKPEQQGSIHRSVTDQAPKVAKGDPCARTRQGSVGARSGPPPMFNVMDYGAKGTGKVRACVCVCVCVCGHRRSPKPYGA
jgi:hypothetical protein